MSTMNTVIKNAIIFAAGAGIGGLTGAIIAAKKIDEKWQKSYEKEQEAEKNKESLSIDEVGSMVPEEEKKGNITAIKEKIKSAEETAGTRIRRTYENIARGYGDPSEEMSDENHDYKDESYKYEQMNKEANSGHKESPHVITEYQFNEEMDHYDKITIYFYEDDEVLADDNDEVIIDQVAIVGDDALNSFGEGSEDPEVVYVRNDKLAIDYEVIRLSKSYSKTVLGYTEEERKQGRRGIDG